VNRHGDGTTFQFERSEFVKIRCDWKGGARQLRLGLVKVSKMLLPAEAENLNEDPADRRGAAYSVPRQDRHGAF
jgi:hypothetical protein